MYDYFIVLFIENKAISILFVVAANVALGKTATLSSRAPHWNRAASLAVDGNTNTDFYAGSCVATAEEKDPWLRVDLGRKYLVKSVNLYLLSESCV